MSETRVVPVEATYPMTRDQLVALVAGPYMYHHKMDEAASREADAFNRCRDMTIERIDVLIATRNAMLAAAPAAPPTDAAQVSEMVRTAPARIWIDVSEDEDLHDEPFPHDLVEDMTWSITRGSASTVEYVRADIAASADAQGDGANVPIDLLKLLKGYAIAFDDEGAANAVESIISRAKDWPECSGDPTSCPENEGYGCCKRIGVSP